jgi:hypothetical protein
VKPECLERDKNLTCRSREYLTLDEVKSVIDAADNRGRHKEHDRCLLLLVRSSNFETYGYLVFRLNDQNFPLLKLSLEEG